MPGALSLSTAGTMALGSNGANTIASGLLRITSSTRPSCSGGASLRGMKWTIPTPSAFAAISPPMRTPRKIGFDGLRVNVAIVSALADEELMASIANTRRRQAPRWFVAIFTLLRYGNTSVPIPKFAHPCGRLECELRNQRDTSQLYDSGAAFEPDVRKRTCGIMRANFGFAALAAFSIILLVRNMLEPGDMFTVEVLLQCQVHHGGAGTGAVPVLFSRGDPDRIARSPFAHPSPP